MNWAEESVRRAKGAAPGFPMPEEPGELRDRAIRINERAESVRVGYFMGAKWQREQLRTPEAIERVARGIHDHECACGDLNNEEYGEDGTEYFIDKAKAAISALLMED